MRIQVTQYSRPFGTPEFIRKYKFLWLPLQLAIEGLGVVEIRWLERATVVYKWEDGQYIPFRFGGPLYDEVIKSAEDLRSRYLD